ncbi:hypothetical protein GCM10027575_85300 [Phytohabitans suffuscus]
MNSEIYFVIYRRRDVRAEFTGAPVPEETLWRILAAAHAAPSVGLTQPWDFILIRDQAIRDAFVSHVQHERAVFADTLDGTDAERFGRIKIDGVRESSLSIVVTYDSQRGALAVLGRLRSPTPFCTRCVWPSRTCGWPPLPKVSAWAGCPSIANRSFATCWESQSTSGQWRGCVWGRSITCTLRQTWNAAAGALVNPSTRSFTRIGGQRATHERLHKP